VEVTRGAVAVGPAGNRGETNGRVLIAPARASFRNAQLVAWLPLPGPAAVAVASEPAPPAVAPLAFAPVPTSDPAPLALETPAEPRGGGPLRPGALPAATEPAPVPVETAVEPVEPVEPEPPGLTIGQARSRVTACLKAAGAAAATGVDLTISTTVSLDLDASQRVSVVRFNPPLKPAVQQACANELFGQRMDVVGPSVSFGVQLRSQ